MRLVTIAVLAALACEPAHAAERLYLQYEGKAWGFLPLGQASMDVSVRADAYSTHAKLRSGGFLKLFDNTDIDATANGDVTSAGLVWEHYDLDHSYAKKHRSTEMWVSGGDVKTDVKPVWMHLGDPPASKAEMDSARDPLSSLIAMGVTVARTHECVGDFPTFDGRHFYILRFKGDVKQGHITTDGYEGPVLKCTTYYVPVAGYDPNDAIASRKKTPKAELWFALTDNPDFAPPVRAVVPLGLGAATLSLSTWRKAVVTVGVDQAEATSFATAAPPATPASQPAPPQAQR